MIFDILLLAVQVVLLSLIVAKELLNRGKKNLVAVFFCAAHLVLVEGQALYVLYDLAQNSEPVFYASNVITFRSFTLANTVLTISVLVIYIVHHLTAGRTPLSYRAKPPEYRETLFSYVVVIGLMLVACYLLINKLGGLRRFYYSMGVMVGGQVFLMILLSIGKLPLLGKIAASRKPNCLDWLLFSVAGLLILLNSRGTAILLVMQYLLLGYFCGRDTGTSGVFLKIAVVFFLVVIVYGGIRDFVTPRKTFEGLFEYYFTTRGPNEMKALGMGDLFFRFMIGPFAGLAGILNTYIGGGVDHDFGISNLCLLTHLIPYGIRAAVLPDIEGWLTSFFAVSGSVVPGGYEASFVHLGFAGIFILSLFLGALPGLLHKRLVCPGADRLKYAMLAVHLPNCLLVPLWFIIFWTLAELSILFLYRLILSAGMSFEHRQCTVRFAAPIR